MPDFAEVTIDGSYPGTYLVPVNQVQYLTDELLNTSSSTIYLYSVYGNSYPQIRIAANSNPVYYTQNNYSGVDVSGVTSVEFNFTANIYRAQSIFPLFNSFLLVLLSLCVFLRRT